MGLEPVDSLLFGIGLVLESGSPLVWSKNVELRLQRFSKYFERERPSKNFERERPMVSFRKLFACVGLFGEQTLFNNRTFLAHKATLGWQRKRGAFFSQHTLGRGTPNKQSLGAWWKACGV